VIAGVFSFFASCGGGGEPQGVNVIVQASRLVSGEPLAGAEVVFLDEEGNVQSESFVADAEGMLEVALPPGNYSAHLRAWRHDILPATIAGSVDISAPGSGVEHVSVTSALREGLGSTGWVDIWVEDEAGSAVGGALVIAYSEEQCNADTGTSWGYADVTGRARVTNLAAGVYTVKAYAREQGPLYVGSVTVQAGTGNQSPAKIGVHGAGLATVRGTLAGNPGLEPVVLSLHEPITGAMIPGTRLTVEGADFQWENVPAGRFFIQLRVGSKGYVLSPENLKKGSIETIGAASSCTPNEARVEGVSVHTVDVEEVSVAVTMVQALELVKPTGGTIQAVNPELGWTVFPNTDFYVIEVQDSTGHAVFGGFALDGTPRMKVPPETSALFYGDLAYANVDPSFIPSENLVSGSIYDWRVFACKNDASPNAGCRAVSSSAQGAGRFVYAPPEED